MLTKLFTQLNLSLPKVAIIDCLLFCRGMKMENSDPEQFDIERFYQWFIANIRTFRHIHTKDVDP